MMGNKSSLRETLMAYTTQQLDDMLQEKLRTDPIDEDTVRIIMSILEEREADYPVAIDDGVAKAWEKYQIGREAAPPRRIIKWDWMVKAASVLLAVGIAVSCFSQEANADAFWGKIARWSDSIFELFSPGYQNDNEIEYVFKTDHPGLQRVYDAVSELGVTTPVVPMYLPEEFELRELKQCAIPKGIGIIAFFSGKDGDLVLRFDVFSDNGSAEYHKGQDDVAVFEMAGTTHYLMRNNDRYTATWVNQNVECFISSECQENVLQKILESIYIMEGA